ncbi:hypothetical protein M404DRAFT_150965 [Pisolithus tinctorius Marx 270]|uniref:CCHC-type domain-containing protein n=1 Tax=Pisolithus tinctorius Marx 270 TaxID=870435 RepID=A0A0C3NJI9_PISTI|nr:hypothetical protein M404DRAFT_150965 [Pisolithus tinctorius Marx 270]
MTRTRTQARADRALESASASRPTQPETSDDLRRQSTLSSLASHCRTSAVVQQFQGFSACRSGTAPASNDRGTPTPAGRRPSAPFGNPGGDGDDDPDDSDHHSSDDDNDNNDDPFGPNPEEGEHEETEGNLQLRVLDSLTRAVQSLARSSRRDTEGSSGSAKVRELDTFDGTDPKKLQQFLIQCELTFQNKPRTFCDDCRKVTFAQSYLKGMALEWFEPDLLLTSEPEDPPLWMDSWCEFVIELQSTFGPHDPVAEAESQLDHLTMKETHRINKYMISRVGKPRTLEDLRRLAQDIDACYWERHEEVQRQNRSSGNQNSSKTGNRDLNTDKGKTSASNTSQSPATPKTGSTNARSSKPETASNKLGKDGKLMAAEQKQRFDLKLCMFCGGDGHIAKECPKKVAKARAAAAAPEATPEASTEAKK